MKKKVGELYDRPIVIGNPNEVNKDEILLKNTGGGITLSERKDGELEDITTTPPKYPRCFIWYDKGNDGDVGEPVPLHCHIGNTRLFENNDGILASNYIMFDSELVVGYDSSINVDSFLSRHKGKYKEISLKEYMGECPEGDFGIIKIPMPYDQNGQVIYTLVEDELSKKRINYLNNNVENKYNIIRIYASKAFNNNYYYVNVKSYTIDKENNCIVFEIEQIPPLDMATQVRVSLDAEVLK